METFLWLLRGGFAKGYRTQILGGIVALSAFASFAVGDWSIADLIQHLPAIAGGLGLSALGSKTNEQTKTIEETKAVATSGAIAAIGAEASAAEAAKK
jgi:hypothetical protein